MAVPSSAYRPKSLWTSLWLAGAVAFLANWSACANAAPIWLSAQQARSLSPLMVKASDMGLVEADAPGDCLIPTVTATPEKPAPDSWAEFVVEVPQSGTYYLWARLRYPSGRPESFRVIPAGPSSTQSVPLVLGGSSQGVRQWHWDSQGNGGKPGAGRLKLELNAGKCTFRVAPCRVSTTAYGPGEWREADLSASPRLNLLCLTDDPSFVPTDATARQALGLSAQAPPAPRVTQEPLLQLREDQPLAGSHKPLPEWMRVPRWFTKDSWREEVPTRHAGDTARLVREVAANGGAALRLSCFWGGETYFQSQVAPHAPGLGQLDYLREALEEGARTGVKVIAYMNPNALYTDHPLLNACAVRGPDGQVSSQFTYGGGPFANTRYACINNPRYRQFLHDVLTEIFTHYQPAGLYVDGLTPHLCFCSHCQAKWREMFHQDMPVAKLSHLSAGWAVWAEMGRDPQPVGDVEKDPDAQHLTELMLNSLVEMTHELSRTVKQINPEALTAFHSHPKPGTEADYDATLTEVYLTRPWTHIAWRSGELAGYSAVYRVPVLFNIYPHANCTAAEARYHALQGLANGAYPNFWTAMGMKPVFDYMARCAEHLDFDTTVPVKFLALPRDLNVSEMQRQAPLGAGVSYGDHDRFLSPYVGAYSALMRSGLPVVTLHRPHFEEELAGFKTLLLANVALLSDAQAEAVRRFVRDGGGLIATHETSLLDEKGHRRTDFALADVLGVHYKATLPSAAHWVNLDRKHPLASGLPAESPLLYQEPLVAVEPAGAEAVGSFTAGHPGEGTPPAVLAHQYGRGRVVYLPGRFDSMECYQLTPTIERLFANAVRWIAPEGLPVEVNAPGTIGVTLFRQPNRLIVHLVNHERDSQLRRDTFAPIPHVRLRLAVPPGAQVERVRRLWEDRELPFQFQNQRVEVEVGTLNEYEALTVEWK